MSRFKFGDLITNKFVSNKNPNKILMVLSHNKNVRCISRSGHQVYFEKPNIDKLEKVNEVSFSNWDHLLTLIKT